MDKNLVAKELVKMAKGLVSGEERSKETEEKLQEIENGLRDLKKVVDRVSISKDINRVEKDALNGVDHHISMALGVLKMKVLK